MSKISASAFVVAAALAAGGAWADKDGHGHGRGHGDKHGRGHEHSQWDDRDHARDGGCPPGLAKKHNGCMPPGHAKRLRVGQRLPADVVYYTVPQPVLVQLPPPRPGYRYVRVGNDVVLLQPRTGVVINIFANLG